MSSLAAHIDVPVPSSSATLDDRGAVLRVSGVTSGPIELRVDEGMVFARYLSAEPRLWTPVTLSSVMEFFVHDSPVSTWLRQQGAFPLRQLLLDTLTTADQSGDVAS